MKKNRKHLLITLCLMLVVCVVSVGGTLAWLTDKTGEVKNTFTKSDVDIDLTETIPENKTAKMVPGETIGKDPKVKILADSEACWVFVKIEKSNNFDSFMTYDIADCWTELDGVPGVYFMVQDDVDEDKTYSILDGDKVTVLGEGVTKKMMDDLTDDTNPTLSFTAYAIQYSRFEPADETDAAIQTAAGLAWAEANK